MRLNCKTLPVLLLISLLIALPAAARRKSRHSSRASEPRVGNPIPPTWGGGWERSCPTRTFSSDTLHESIDGGAELFLEYGFQSLTLEEVKKKDFSVTIELYRMADPAAALGIYLGRCGRERPIPGLAARHTASDQQLLLVRERFLLVLNCSGRQMQRTDFTLLAKTILFRLPAAQAVTELALLPQEGRVPGSDRLFRGPLALQSTLPLGEGDILQLAASRVTAVSADFLDGLGGRSTRLVAPYPTPEAASRAFQNLQAHLDPSMKAEEKTATRLVFRNASTHYGLALLRGTRIEVTLNLSSRP